MQFDRVVSFGSESLVQCPRIAPALTLTQSPESLQHIFFFFPKPQLLFTSPNTRHPPAAMRVKSTRPDIFSVAARGISRQPHQRLNISKRLITTDKRGTKRGRLAPVWDPGDLAGKRPASPLPLWRSGASEAAAGRHPGAAVTP